MAAQCSRRAGKTNGLALRFIRTMRKYPGETCRYMALTRDSAKEIMWPVLLELNDRFSLGADFSESKLTMTLPNGGRLKLFGADMKNFIRRLKGVKSPGNAIDEAQDFTPDLLEMLMDDVIEPSMADFQDSWLALTGTPGPIPRGRFFEVTKNGWGGFSVHKWGLFNNPYMPDPRGFVERLKKKKGWDERTPTLMREYGNEWVLDLESLLIRYDATRNDWSSLLPLHWNYIMGVDIGHKDADAIAILAWSESCDEIFLIEECVTPGQDITALASQMEAMIKKYEPSKIVMDTGGLGKKIAEEITRRKHIPIQAADKVRKFENVAFLNDWLRQGKFKAQKASRFAQDSYQLQIDHDKTTPDRLVVKKGFHSDIIDAVLYAFKESPAFTFTPEKPKPKWGTKTWAQEEQERMEEAAEEHFKRLAEEPEQWVW